MISASATFEIQMNPGALELEGASRLDFTKQWAGDLSGTSKGVMLTAGNPQMGTAGYVAIEVFAGILAGSEGTFAFQQCGSMHDSQQRLTYEVVPGSGTGDLTGLTGTIRLTVDDTHHVELDYELPQHQGH